MEITVTKYCIQVLYLFTFTVTNIDCSAEWLKKEAEKMNARREEAEVEEQKMVEEVSACDFVIISSSSMLPDHSS